MRGGRGDPGATFDDWVRGFFAYFIGKRPIAAELLEHAGSDDPVFGHNRARVLAAGQPLLAAAQDAGAVRSDLTLEQALDLVIAIAKIPADADYLAPILRPRSTGCARAEPLLGRRLPGLGREPLDLAAVPQQRLGGGQEVRGHRRTEGIGREVEHLLHAPQQLALIHRAHLRR